MPVFLYGWVESVALEEREEKRHPLNKGMPCKEADGLKRELTLERERERERDRAPAKRGVLTPLEGERGWRDGCIYYPIVVILQNTLVQKRICKGHT